MGFISFSFFYLKLNEEGKQKEKSKIFIQFYLLKAVELKQKNDIVVS